MNRASSPANRIVSDTNATSSQSRRFHASWFAAIAAGLVLVALFVVLLFPWDSVARRIAFEISSASGGEVEIGGLRPTLTARGPVLAAENVEIRHRASGRVLIRTLEIAPRGSRSWLSGEPTFRIWADSELALIDGVLQLGESSGFVGRIERVAIEELPLRLEASGVALFGLLDADADVVLDPRGMLRGKVRFESGNLLVQSDQLPLAIPFSRATGVVEVLESGATRIESLELDGNVVKGKLSGEIALVHRSQSPPIDLSGELEIVEPALRSMAPQAGLSLSSAGRAMIKVSGTLDAPLIETF